MRRREAVRTAALAVAVVVGGVGSGALAGCTDDDPVEPADTTDRVDTSDEVDTTDERDAEEAETLVAGEGDAGEELELVVGQRLEIRIDFNASIGDDWRLSDEGDADVLEYLGDDVELDDPEADGSGGTLTYAFEALAGGETSIELTKCYRGSCPDDPDPEPETAELSFPVVIVP
ncbi:MAG: protease inhibitor I42 family protein [Acidimicrobiales bacterium]|jgi:predicted secreted protein|nr:protease inhibitor I42 family protein [Acidimicrobiales bacterium]